MGGGQRNRDVLKAAGKVGWQRSNGDRPWQTGSVLGYATKMAPVLKGLRCRWDDLGSLTHNPKEGDAGALPGLSLSKQRRRNATEREGGIDMFISGQRNFISKNPGANRNSSSCRSGRSVSSPIIFYVTNITQAGLGQIRPLFPIMNHKGGRLNIAYVSAAVYGILGGAVVLKQRYSCGCSLESQF